MALRFHEGWDYLTASEFPARWNNIANATLQTGRNSGKCFRTTGSTGLASITLDAQATWIVGFAYRSVGGISPATGNGIVRFVDGSTLHFDLRRNADGTLFVTRNGTTLSTGTTALVADVFYYVEVKLTIGDAGSGSYQVRIDGVDEIHSTGSPVSGDTRNGGNASANVITFSGSTTNSQDVDDIYICDGTGSGPYNDFLGDCRAEAIYPNGNGNSSGLVGSDGNSTDNYLLVDEATPSTADYVESSTPADKDTYTYGNLTATSGTVYGVSVVPLAAKTDAGTRSIVTVARVSSSEVDSAVLPLSTTPLHLREVPRTAKPGGGSWSVSDVNGAEFGVKVNA